MTSKTKGFLLALDLVILATGFAMLLPPLPAVGLFVIVGGAICGALAWRRRKSLPPCVNCGESFEALEADWCSCLTRHRTLVCTNCLMCFCKAPESYKERFWSAAPPKEPEAPPELLPDVVARPLVMLVESDPRIAATVQRVCRNLGYGIVTAANDEKGRELARKHRPDLVLTPRETSGLSITELINVLLKHFEGAVE